MARSSLEIAQILLKRRKFSQAITILEGCDEIYEGDFEYYVTFATCCLYLGDIGTARNYFQKARSIRMNDSRLLLGQAAIFLRYCETDRALEYYLDIRSFDPTNEVAKKALDFIKKYGGDDTTIRNWVDSGKIMEFYPPLGVNPDIIRNIFLGTLLLALIAFAFVKFHPQKKHDWVGPRANLTAFELSTDEKKNAANDDLSATVVHYILDSKAISKSYENAMQYVEDRRDNAAQVEINRLLNSNASLSIKQKASLLMRYLEVPTFDSLTDNYDYAQVAKEPELYLDCHVAWSGRVSNTEAFANGAWYCELLVGYLVGNENRDSVQGVVPVYFAQEPYPPVDPTKPIRILGQVSLKDGKLCLLGKAVYQPLHGNELK